MPKDHGSSAGQPARPARLQGTARTLALEIAAEARAEWGYTSDLIATTFRKHRELGSGDRRLISETVYGLVRWERRLEAIVEDLLARRRGRKEPVAPAALAALKLLVYELREGPTVAPEAARDEGRGLAGADVDVEAAVGADAGLAGHRGLDREA